VLLFAGKSKHNNARGHEIEQSEPAACYLVTHMLPSIRHEIAEYRDAAGRSPFGRWFEALDVGAAARVSIALERMSQGNFGNAKSVGTGVIEYRLNFGPGYRIYFGRGGLGLIILLGGGTKRDQQRDIEAAKINWQEFKRRMKWEAQWR
jgi:putative addiction module killer protein